MKWRNYFITLILLTGWYRAGAQELPLTHFTSNSEVNALPSALVNHIHQDRQGYIWFSVYTSGLVRYDGSKMERYDKTDGLRDLGVWQMVEDKQGHLWVSSNGGLVVSEKPLQEYIHGEKVSFTSMYKGMLLARDPVGSNQEMVVDSLGRVWMGTTDKGLIRYQIDNQGISADTLSTAISGANLLEVHSLTSAGKGGIFAALEGGILAEYQENRLLPVDTSGSKAAGENFTSLFQDKNGGIWAYRQSGEILHFENRGAAPRQVLKTTPSNVTDITSLQDGSIMAGNGEIGIHRIYPETGEIKTYTKANGLLNENVYYIFEDREENVWIAQSGGVSKLRYNFDAFENYSARLISGDKPVLPSGKINSILISGAANSPCRFWVGTEGGATCVDANGASVFVTQADGLTADWVNGLAKDKQGRIWIATTQGLNVLVFDKKLLPKNHPEVNSLNLFGKEAFLVPFPNSPPFLAAENLKLQSKNSGTVESLWFAGRNSLYTVTNGEMYEFGPRQGLPLNIYTSMAFDKEGHLWVGTRERGLFRSNIPVTSENLENLSKTENNLFEQVWSLEQGAPTNHVEKLLFYQEKLWMGTQLGLYVLDPEKEVKILDHLDRKRGLPANNAIGFALSPLTGNLWVGTNNGLAEVVPETGKVIGTVQKKNGLIDNEVWLYGSVKVDKAGNVFYGTSNGLSIYHPEKDHPNLIPPKLQLTSAEISYQKDSRNEANFEYAALSYANVADVRYRTRLVGYDNNWSPPSEIKRLRYTNLPAYLWPKEYTLEVMAVNESGIAAEKLEYSFVVQPVWWLQWWAFVIYLLLLAGIVAIIDQVQRRRLIKRERNNARIREAELQAETANARSAAAESQALALQAENERKALELEKARELETAYNELKATQNQLIQAEKMASLGRLATGVAHEIKNPLNFINNFAELSVDLVEELEEARNSGNLEEINLLMQDLKENTAKIEKHGKRADAIVRSMMQHARGGESTMALFDLNALVNDYLDLAYRGKANQHPDLEVEVVREFDPNVGKLKLVGQEVGQVLLNVIGNSLDAILEKKKAKGKDYLAQIKVKTRRIGDFAEIIISDNGPGVPEEIREKIFEPFFTTKPTGEGTGLGLSLSYNIITQGHNGSLRLENNEREGATFIIALPVPLHHPKKDTKLEVRS